MSPELELLYGYPAGTDPEYAELAELEVASYNAFDGAVRAYGARRYLEAARGFMAAAAALEDRPDRPLRDLFAKNRWVCYSNARLAFGRGGAAAEGRAALTAAAGKDPANAAAIRDLLDQLPP